MEKEQPLGQGEKKSSTTIKEGLYACKAKILVKSVEGGKNPEGGSKRKKKLKVRS